MTDYGAEIDEILIKLVARANGIDMVNKPKNLGLATPSTDVRVAKQALQSLIAKAEVAGRIDELENIPTVPPFLFSTRNDPAKAKEAMAKSQNACLWIIQRQRNLKAQGQSNG